MEKHWVKEDTPAYKLNQYGTNVLSDSELLSIIFLGPGESNSVAKAREFLYKIDNDLNKIGKMSIPELMKYGITRMQSIKLKAATSLSKKTERREIKKVSQSKDVYDLMKPYLTDLDHEEFFILLLNRSNGVIAIKQVSKGGLAGTIADPRIIVRMAIEHKACSIILAHNHPSGNVFPSESDYTLTDKIKAGANYLDIQVLDHVVIADDKYFSFDDEGKI